MDISEAKIDRVIKNVINEVTYGNVDHFTEYSPRQAAINRAAIGHVGNSVYDKFMIWREEGLKKGIPSRELSFEKYNEFVKNS